MNLKYCAKAVVGGIAAFLSILLTVLETLPHGQGLGDLTAINWLTIALATLASFGVVYVVPNIGVAPATVVNPPTTNGM